MLTITTFVRKFSATGATFDQRAKGLSGKLKAPGLSKNVGPDDRAAAASKMIGILSELEKSARSQGPPPSSLLPKAFEFRNDVGKQEEIFEQWCKDIAAIAECPNVVAKLGGMAMPDNGFGWDRNERPATSDEFVAAQQRYYRHTIECFGPSRCMFESNFPPDKLSISYHVLWNGFKKIVADFSDDEKHAMFYGTAARVYRL